MHPTTAISHRSTNDGTTEFITNVDVLIAHGIDPSSIEFPELEVPILTGPQRQGDVFLLPITTDKTQGAALITKAGVTVVRAETNTANTHTLHTLSGSCQWLPNTRANDTGELVQGWLTVAADSEAALIHTEEHNVVGIGAGTYEIRRQREYAGVWQRVAD